MVTTLTPQAQKVKLLKKEGKTTMEIMKELVVDLNRAEAARAYFNAKTREIWTSLNNEQQMERLTLQVAYDHDVESCRKIIAKLNSAHRREFLSRQKQ